MIARGDEAIQEADIEDLADVIARRAKPPR
jgi:hypothetical protein